MRSAPLGHNTRLRLRFAGGAFATVLVVFLALAAGRRVLERTPAQNEAPASMTSPGVSPSTAEAASEAHESFIFGRVTTNDGATYEGRLRFGGDEEAFWGDYFNGFKDENPWVVYVPDDQLTERRPIEIFGIEIAARERQIDLGRPFMARFGDIARIAPNGRELQVTLKSGTVLHLNRFAADDFADGVRVWDGTRGVVNLAESQIRAIDLVSTTRPGTVPDRLHGTVRSRGGNFTGFVQWDREESVGSDVLEGHTAEGELNLRFDTIRSIARSASDGSLVTLIDGREIVLSGTRNVGPGNRGVYVDDRRYGRVLVSWEAFEQVDFGPAGSGPAYSDFPPGRPLTGTVTTRDGRRLSGRLVYDLDESETIETLDAPSQGVDYTILLGLIASIVLPAPEGGAAERATVTLHGGEELRLERAGDLGEGNAGMLVFVDVREQPEYVRWTEIGQIDFDRPPAMFPVSPGTQ